VNFFQNDYLKNMAPKKLDPIHPGEILLKEFIEPMGLSQNRLALALGVPARRINEIVLGKRGITADTALRLARYFKMSPQFWLGLQMDYELDIAEDMLEGRLEKEVTPRSAAG
jgi:addiction module HigA family antidote